MSTISTEAREAIERTAQERREAIARVEHLTDQLAEQAREAHAKGASANSLRLLVRVAPATMRTWLNGR